MARDSLRIDDWRDPFLPAPIRALNTLPERVARRVAPLDRASLLRAARRSTGLHDFGIQGIEEPLELILSDLRADPKLTPLGRITARTVIGQLLRARLRVEAELARHPEVEERAVAPPIVIVGLPRTGTTHLHNLLSRVPALRSLPLWESIEPVPRPGPGDGRRLRAALRLRQLDYLIPHLRRMHEMEVDLPHEELQLTALAFRSFFFESSFRLPGYRRWYADADHRGAYTYLRRVLQLLQTDPGGERWVLKSPQHLDQLDALCAAFPEAKIVRTHRDPARAVLSLASMVTYTRRVCYRDIDAAEEGRAWATRLEGMLRRSLEQVDRLPPRNVLDVRFEKFVADPVGTVEEVLAFAGIAFEPAARERVERFSREHAATRSAFEHRFEDVGLERSELERRFQFYSDRVGFVASG